jgi:hypothetical protein
MDKKLKKEIEKKLAMMEKNLTDREKVRMRREFVDQFVLCEVACKKVQRAYLKAEKKEQKGYEKLHMGVIPKAMAWAGVDITRAELDELFYSRGSYCLRGTKSAKMLRDGAVHEHNEYDIQEISDRFEELTGKMDAFLNLFR